MSFDFYPSRDDGNFGDLGDTFSTYAYEGSVTHDPAVVGYVQAGFEIVGYSYTTGEVMEAEFWRDGTITYNAYIYENTGEAWVVPVRINENGTVVEEGTPSDKTTAEGRVSLTMENVTWDSENIADSDRFGIAHYSRPTNADHIIGWVVSESDVYVQTPHEPSKIADGGSENHIDVSPEGRGQVVKDYKDIYDGSENYIDISIQGNGNKEFISRAGEHVGRFIDFGSKPPDGESWGYFWEEVEQGSGTWEEGTHYLVGDTVEIDGQSYECITQHFAYEAGVYENFDWGDRPEDEEYFDILYNRGYPALRKTIEGVWWIDIPIELDLVVDGRSSVFLVSPYNLFVKSGGQWIRADAFTRAGGSYIISGVFYKRSGSWQEEQ